MKTIILLIALVLVGCGDTRQVPEWSRVPATWAEDSVKGHTYITFSFMGSNASTIHAEHCKCKEWK